MKTTRRAFLQTAAVVPWIIPSTVWGAQMSPNERITVGFIGVGHQARGLLGVFMPRCYVAAVCDVDATRREAARKQVNDYYSRYPDQGPADCKVYSDYAELLARPDIDAVCIATPDHWHTEITLAALRAGKDVYCEKPLTHDIAEAVAIMKEVDLRGRVLQTGSMQRSSWEFRTACELAQNGAIGKISRIECSFGDPARPCDLPGEAVEPGLDWNAWCGPAPLRAYHSELSPRGSDYNHWPNWRQYKEYGGGMVCDWGAHHLDIAQWALGMDDSGPVKIVPPDDRNAKRGVRLIYANGTEVIHKDGFGVHMFGADGEIRVNRGRIWFTLGGEEVKFTQREDGGSLESKLTLVERNYLKDAKVRLYKVRDCHPGDFLECMRSRKKPITHEGVGGRSAICCHLMNLAYWHGQTMEWDPKTCTFANGTGDPKWLIGERRDWRKA